MPTIRSDRNPFATPNSLTIEYPDNTIQQPDNFLCADNVSGGRVCQIRSKRNPPPKTRYCGKMPSKKHFMRVRVCWRCTGCAAVGPCALGLCRWACCRTTRTTLTSTVMWTIALPTTRSVGSGGATVRGGTGVPEGACVTRRGVVPVGPRPRARAGKNRPRGWSGIAGCGNEGGGEEEKGHTAAVPSLNREPRSCVGEEPTERTR